jgi:hypothetical protein
MVLVLLAAPLTGSRSGGLRTLDLKIERLHAYELVERPERLPPNGQQRSADCASGVVCTIGWLLGDSTPLPLLTPLASVLGGCFP